MTRALSIGLALFLVLILAGCQKADQAVLYFHKEKPVAVEVTGWDSPDSSRSWLIGNFRQIIIIDADGRKMVWDHHNKRQMIHEFEAEVRRVREAEQRAIELAMLTEQQEPEWKIWLRDTIQWLAMNRRAVVKRASESCPDSFEVRPRPQPTTTVSAVREE